LQFLWGARKDKVVFPGILGLLDQYSEAWFDTIDDTDDEKEESETCSMKLVPWIDADSVAHIMELGEKVDRKPDGQKVFGSSVRVSDFMLEMELVK
jgi:hypothetical protein